MAVEPLLQLTDVSFSYPNGTRAITGLSLRLQHRQRVAILGNNGAGKSTLFLLLNGINKIQSGSYAWNGQKINYAKKELLALRKAVGVVFQDPENQLFLPTVYEEVAFGPLNLKLPQHEVKQRVETALHLLGIADLQNEPPHLLSYGQKKRVTIASVLSMKPQLLVLDEPTSGLDCEYSQQFEHVLQQLHAGGTSILLSTHDVDFALRWADWVVLMHKGTIVASASAIDIFLNTPLLKQCGLKTPTVLQIYQSVAHRCKINNVPRTVQELTQILTTL